MKYQPGDTVAFNVPPSPQDDKSGLHGKGRSPSKRFDIGVIRALREEQNAYQITGLNGRDYTISEGNVTAKVGDLLEGHRTMFPRGPQVDLY